MTPELIDTSLLRIRAESKFDDPSRMLFDRAGLEQATSQRVAEYRAGRIAIANPDRVIDLGCGLGGDAVALTDVAR